MEKIQPIIDSLKQKKYLYALLAVGVIIFIVVISSLLPTPSNNQTPNNTPSSKLSEGVSSTTPQSNATGISLYQPLIVVFTNPVPVQEQKNTRFTIFPETKGSTSWSDDNKTATFNPTTRFVMDTKYSVTILYPDGTYSWKFQTVPEDKLPNKDLEKLQTEADDDYAAFQKDLYTKYPWYDKLPIMNDNYFFYFDSETKSFTGIVYLHASNKTPQDQYIAQTQKEIINKVQQLNIPISSYETVWKTTPLP